MRNLLLILTTLFILCGCEKKPSIVSIEELPNKVYGTDPLSHTMYIGSDANYHHFTFINGKISGSFIVNSDDYCRVRDRIQISLDNALVVAMRAY